MSQLRLLPSAGIATTLTGALKTKLSDLSCNYHSFRFLPFVKGSLKNNFTFYTPMHPAWLRCESSEYPDIPAFSRLARQASQRLKL
jgi:hypothetical protein